MKVIITKRFEKEYLDDLSKYFTKNDLVEFLKERSYTFIHLHYPYFKIKNRINNFAFRGFVAFIKNDRIIPLMMFTKKDKNNGENLNWRDYKDVIGYEYDKAVEDIKNKKFEEF